jgi:hypothetical protein
MVTRHRQTVWPMRAFSSITPEALTRTVEDLLAGARDAVVTDEGAVLFDLAQAKCSIAGERQACYLSGQAPSKRRASTNWAR